MDEDGHTVHIPTALAHKKIKDELCETCPYGFLCTGFLPGSRRQGIGSLKELGLDKTEIISIAKREERVFTEKNQEGIVLNFSLPYANLITKVRNESHRFANEYRETLYKKKNFNSVLKEIPGVGDKTVRKLIRKFKSIEGIAKADINELEKTVSKPLAEKIKKFL